MLWGLKKIPKYFNLVVAPNEVWLPGSFSSLEHFSIPENCFGDPLFWGNDLFPLVCILWSHPVLLGSKVACLEAID